METAKRRGRPRKSSVNKTENKKYINATEIKSQLILHLPIQSNTNKDELITETEQDIINVDTESSDEDEYEDEYEENINYKQKDKSDSDSEKSEDKSLRKKIVDYRKILKKKEATIKKMSDELHKYREAKEIFEDSIKYIPLDLKLISNNDGITEIKFNVKYACWWCTYDFENCPFFIPDKIDKEVFYVFGNFCSPSCAASYNENMSDYRTQDRHTMIKMLACKILNIDNYDIKYAPPKEILEKYGGPMTIDTFREKNKLWSVNYKLLMPPMLPITSYFEERKKYKK
jgi:hypothetical protein